MSTENLNIFVYGSLRSGFRTDAYQYLTKYFVLKGDAFAQGKLLDKGDYPVAVSTSEDKFIFGELYAIKNPMEFNWAIEQLDDYEGLNVEEGETPMYKRQEVVAYQNNEPYKAWVYWYNGDINGLPDAGTGDVFLYFANKNK